MNKRVVIFILSLVTLVFIGGMVLADGPIILTDPMPGIKTFGDLFAKISTGIFAIVGSLSAIMIIVAGGMFLLSAGNPAQVQNAKKALTYAIIGIVVSLLAGTIIVILKEIIGAKS